MANETTDKIVKLIKKKRLTTIPQVNDFILKQFPTYYAKNVRCFRYTIGEDKILARLLYMAYGGEGK